MESIIVYIEPIYYVPNTGLMEMHTSGVVRGNWTSNVLGIITIPMCICSINQIL